MPDIGKEMALSAFRSKREYDGLAQSLSADLQALNSKTNTEALRLYQSLEERLEIVPRTGSIAVIESSMENLERLSRFMPSMEDFINEYRRKYQVVYESNRIEIFRQLIRKERRLMEILAKAGINEDRVTASKSSVDMVNAVNSRMYRVIDEILRKWKNFVYDTFFEAIGQSKPLMDLKERWRTDSGTLRIGSSLEDMTDAEAMIAATQERTAYLREQAKINGYQYCWNVNPMDERTKAECIGASLAGVIPESQMAVEHGFPPRQVCRCDMAYTRGEWVEFNSSINKQMEDVRGRLIQSLIDAPRQKSSWERIVGGKSTTVTPKDPARASGTKMYADIETKLAKAEGMTVPEYRYEIGEGGA